MTQVWERLFIGSLADAERLARGNPHNIDAVISLCEECVASKRRGVSYVHIAVEDDRQVPVGKFDSIMDAIAENVRWGNVLVNCGAGISRAPAMTAAYMHCVGYRNINAVLAEFKRLRPIIDPSRILLESIRRHQ